MTDEDLNTIKGIIDNKINDEQNNILGGIEKWNCII